MKHTVLLSVLVGFGLLGLLPGDLALTSAQAARKSSWSLQHYRRINRMIYQRYRAARKNRWREPCRARNRLVKYQQWLARLQEQLPSLALHHRHRYYLKHRIRRYKRYSRSQHRLAARGCRRYWKSELKRQNNRMNTKCRSLYGPSLREEAAGLWVGVTPWAYVYLNGNLCGTSPLFARLRPGTYQVRLLYPPGQDEHKTTVQLQAGRKATLIARHMKTPPPAPRRFKNLLAPEQLKWVLARHRKNMQSCSIYAPQIATLSMSWQINPKGRVHSVQWERPTDAPPRFRQCIIRALQRIQFPARQGVARIHSYEISLRDEP